MILAGVANILIYYRIFKKLKLDLLSVTTYVAYLLAFNLIEHLWPPFSDVLAGVVFSSKLDGDSKPPWEQSRLSNDELREKEHAVFYNDILEPAMFMECAQFDGFLIKLDKVICENDALKWDGFLDVKGFFKVPMRDLHKYEKLMSECKRMLNHVDSHLNEVVFARYKNTICCCELSSKSLFKHLEEFKVKLPAHTLGKYNDGYYKTFLNGVSKRRESLVIAGNPLPLKPPWEMCPVPKFQF